MCQADALITAPETFPTEEKMEGQVSSTRVETVPLHIVWDNLGSGKLSIDKGEVAVQY